MLPDLFPEELEALDERDFQFFRDRVFQVAGISMADSKRDLIQGRLKSRVKEHGLRNLSEYRQFLESLPPGHLEWQGLINQVTTNKTEFFREPKHFAYLVEEFLPAWKKRSQGKPLNVWCAASSTGEEPYTLALVLSRHVRDFKILATDIDTNVLARASNAVYSSHLLGDIPGEYQSCFEKGTGEISDWMRVKKKFLSHVKFEQLNLTKLPYEMKGKFDLIFCRNVLIYFSKETVHSVTEGLFANAKKGAELIIGHSESLNTSSRNRESSWEFIRPSIYRKTK